MNKRSSFILFFCCLTSLLRAQQEASFSLYMFNHQAINPAYVGATGVTQITAGTRNQWSGITGAPETHAFSISHLVKNKNVGVGLSNVTDNIGPTKRVNIAVDLSYHLPLNDTGMKLGLGLKVSNRSFRLDPSILSPTTSGDSFLSNTPLDDSSPNIGFGLYLQHPNFYLGVGLPYFIQDEEIYLNRYYYAIGGFLVNLNSFVQIKPSILFQKMEANPLVYDVSILFSYQDIFFLGPQYRANVQNAFPNQNTAGFYGILTGLNITNNLTIGYAYQGTLANINIGITNTSHEILLRFQLGLKEIGFLRSPRLF